MPDDTNNLLSNLLLEAGDVSTPPARLTVLSVHRDPAIRQAVTANPNTPSRVLERLSVMFPEAFFANSILDLLSLENPNFIADLPAWARSRVLACETAPEGFLRWAEQFGNDEALLAVCANRGAPQAMLGRLCDHHDAGVARAAQLHLNSGREPSEGVGEMTFTQILQDETLERDSETLKALLVVNLATPEVLEVLAIDNDADVRKGVAQHLGVPSRILEQLAADDDEDVRAIARANLRGAGGGAGERFELVARLEVGEMNLNANELERASDVGVWAFKLAVQQSNAPMMLLEKAAQSEDWRVREAAARNPNLSGELLEKLALDSDRDVRAAIAANTHLNAETLERLLGDTSEEVRAVAVQHPHAPKNLLDDLERAKTLDANLTVPELEKLAESSEWARRVAAQHPKMPAATLERFATHEDWCTRQAVARNESAPVNVLEVLAQDSDADVRGAVAANRNVSASVLEMLAADNNHEVRKFVALNVRISTEFLGLLAEDANWIVRQAVASNTNTPEAALEKLAFDSDRDVKQAVAENPSIPESALEVLFSKWFASLENVPGSLRELYRRARSQDLSLEATVLEQLAQGGEWAKLLAAKHPNTPEKTLLDLSVDEDWRTRQSVAQNPSSSASVLEKMLEDTDHDVRTATAAHQNTATSMFDALARDSHGDVRRALLERNDVTQAVVIALLCDEEDDLRALAREHHLAPKQMLETIERAENFDPSLERQHLGMLAGQGVRARMLAAKNTNTDSHILHSLAQDEDWHVRQAVAQNPSVNPNALELLAEDSDRDVRAAVATNTSINSKLLEQFVTDSDELVRNAALRNPNLPAQILGSQRRTVLGKLARAREPFNRMIALMHPLFSLRELQKHRNQNSLEWRERLAVTHNPNLPLEVLQTMTKDANRIVRAAAIEQLADRGF
jgi:Leucine rich repeat variant